MILIDRIAFFKKLQRFIKKHKIQSTTEITDDMIIVTTLVEDFDPDSNAVWHLDANKSYPREGIVCHECKRPIVMSNFAFNYYQKNPNPKQVMCGTCVFSIAHKQYLNEKN